MQATLTMDCICNPARCSHPAAEPVGCCVSEVRWDVRGEKIYRPFCRYGMGYLVIPVLIFMLHMFPVVLRCDGRVAIAQRNKTMYHKPIRVPGKQLRPTVHVPSSILERYHLYPYGVDYTSLCTSKRTPKRRYPNTNADPRNAEDVFGRV